MNIKVKKHYSEKNLKTFLKNKHSKSMGYLDLKNHIDSCERCWSLWNKVRWDLAKGSIGMSELKEYLGTAYHEYFDSSWAIANEWNALNPQSPQEIANFYKKTENYLFNLVIWHESGDREPFYLDLIKLINKFNVKSVVDFGCGVGTDSLSLIELGMKVSMVDYDCPTTQFLKWRLKKRNLIGDFIDVEKVMKLPEVDLFWAIDVLEHLPDPTKVVEILNDKTKIFVHRSQFNDQAGGRHPCHIINFEEKRLIDLLTKKDFINIPWNKLSVWVKRELI